jgi:energy-coupling factor transporter ATP-binding protein EcfA2
MISHLELQNFRGLEHVKFENLGRVNLIMGGNNAGKTSILEALALVHGNAAQIKELPTTFRVLPNQDPDSTSIFWRSLVRGENISGFSVNDGTYFYQGDSINDTWRIREALIDEQVESVVVAISPDGSVKLNKFVNKPRLCILSTKQADPGSISELYNRIAPLNPDNEDKIEELLRNSIEPRLRRLRYAKPQGTKTHLVYVDLGEGKMIPFTQMGQAFARTLQVYCEIFGQRPKMLLIDEIENGLYYEGMEDFWKGLMAVLEDQDVQLFATTHSRECMEAAYRAAKDMPNDPLRYLRLDRRIDDPAKIVATTFGKEEMATAIEFNREMR